MALLKALTGMKNRPFLPLLISFLLCLGAAACAEDAPLTRENQPAIQVSAPQKMISVIKVKGNKAISSATILSKIKSKPGDAASQDQLNADLKRLFGLGFFTDIAIETEDYQTGIAVTFVVVEKPLISQITFTGNRSFRAEKLKKEIKSSENEMLDETKLRADMETIKAMYQKKGFQLAEAKYTVDVDKAKNTVKVSITIDEKTRVRIKKVIFTGNKSIPSKKLLKSISTRPDTLFTSGYFKEDTFNTDLEKLKEVYETAGFLDVKIVPNIEYDKSGRWMNITVEVAEGKKYIVGTIEIKGDAVFPEKEIRARLKMVSTQPFSQIGLRLDISNIQQFYYQKGYMLAKVAGSTLLNQQTGKVDITYEITENALIYIDKIKIKGNLKTKDMVIRRELRSYPGEKFDGDKLRRSKERLYNLGYFEEVVFETEPGSAPNKEDLIVTVKETKTGEFSFGGGFSSVDRLIGFVSVTQKNFDILNFPTFTGDGQKLKLQAQVGTVKKDYDLGWVEPWIFDLPLLFGFDAYQRNHSKTSNTGYGYDERRTGGDLRLGKEFTEYLNADLFYINETVKIGDVDSGASQDLRDEEGKNKISKMLLALAEDHRDNVYNPTSGYLLGFSTEAAGGILGGTKDFTKNTLNGSVYFSFFEKIVLEIKGLAGITDAYGNSSKVPIYERFYAGGSNTIRGYRERRIGPKDPSTNDPIGGEAVALANAELTFPIYESVLKGALFYDAGNVWAKWDEFGQDGLKSGTGFGIRVKTPIGPVKLDYGYPLSDVAGEKKKPRFYFSVSQGF